MGMLRRLGVLSLITAALSLCGCSKDVVVGAVISESGAVSSYGEKVKKGLDLALEEINSGEGINGGRVQLIYKDDATNAAIGRQVTEELIKKDGARIIIGAVSSEVTLNIAPICEESRVILFSPSSSAAAITDAGDYIYRNYPSDILEGTAMARFARDLGLEKVVVFAVKNKWGTGLKDVFSQQSSGRFRKVVESFDLDETNAGDIAAIAQEVKKLAPDGVYIAAYVDELSTVLKALKDAGVKAIVMGSSSVTEDVYARAGEAAENLVYPQANFEVESKEAPVKAFVEAYRAKYGEDPDIYAAHGYDALKLIAEAITIGGSPHPNDVKLGLRGIEAYEGAAGRTVFDANGDVVRYPRIFIFRNGVTQPYEKFVDEGGSLFAGT